MPDYELLCGDTLSRLSDLPDESVRCCVTSPPYWWLRDYGVAGQIGREKSPEEYVEKLVEVFREVGRVLRNDGTLWLNLGDSYAANGGAHGGRSDNQSGVGAKRTHDAGAGDQGARRAPSGLKPKDLVGIPWRVAFALQADGWWLRSDIIWHKPNPMPESVTDRPTRAHEYLFLLAKSERYYYDSAAVAERAVATNDHDATGQGWQAPGQSPQTGSRKSDKQGEGSRRYAGFNARWEAKEQTGQVSRTRNRRSVWTIPPQPFRGAHFAVFPEKLVEPCILAGSEPGDLVLDLFCGSGTVGVVSLRHGRMFLGIDLNPDYLKLAHTRILGAKVK